MSHSKQVLLDIVKRFSSEKLSEVRAALDRAGSSVHMSCPFPGHDDSDPSFRFVSADDADIRFVCSCSNGGLSWFLHELLGWSTSRAETEIAQAMDRLGLKPLTADEIERLKTMKQLNKEAQQVAQIQEIVDILSTATHPPGDYLAERLGHYVESEQLQDAPLSGRTTPVLRTPNGEPVPCRALDVALTDAEGEVVGLQTVWLDQTEPKKVDFEPKYTTLGRKAGVYASFGQYQKGSPVVLVEGELDGLAVYLATGLHTRAACGTGLDQVPLPDGVPYVVVVPDTDAAGIKAADTLSRALFNKRVPLLRAVLPTSLAEPPTIDEGAIRATYGSLSCRKAKQHFLDDSDLHLKLGLVSEEQRDSVIALLSAFDIPTRLIKSKIKTTKEETKVDACDVYQAKGPEYLAELVAKATDDVPADEADRQELDAIRIARVVLQKFNNLRYWANEWWQFDCSIYTRIDQQPKDGQQAVEFGNTNFGKQLTQIVDDDLGVWYLKKVRRYEGLSPELQAQATYPTRTAVTNQLLANVVDRVKELTRLPSLNAPFWIDQRDSDPSPRDLRIDRKGYWVVSSLATGNPVRIEPTSRLFAVAAMDFEINPHKRPDLSDASKRFLESLKLGDDGLRSLQECMGYAQTPPELKIDKAVLLIGASRAGKGVIHNILAGQFASSVADLSGSDFSREHGLTQLIGAYIALLRDVRWKNLANPEMLIERLLSLTSGEPISINPKHRDIIVLHAIYRLFIASNLMPRLPDSSAAIPGRFIAIKFTQSFLGKEDPELIRQVLSDKEAWFWWIYEGYQRVMETGKIFESEAGRDLIRQMAEVNSPIRGFLNEYAVIDPHSEGDLEEGWDLYKRYCEGQGLDTKKLSRKGFGVTVEEAEPTVKKIKTNRTGEDRREVIQGLRWITGTPSATKARSLCVDLFTATTLERQLDILSQLENTELREDVYRWRKLLGLDHQDHGRDQNSMVMTWSRDSHAMVTPEILCKPFTQEELAELEPLWSLVFEEKFSLTDQIPPHQGGVVWRDDSYRENFVGGFGVTIPHVSPHPPSLEVDTSIFEAGPLRDRSMTMLDHQIEVPDEVHFEADGIPLRLVFSPPGLTDSGDSPPDEPDSAPGPDSQPDTTPPHPSDGYAALNLMPDEGQLVTFDLFDRALRLTGRTCKLAESVEEVVAFLESARGRLLSLDFETTDLSGSAESLVGINLALEVDFGLYIPLRHDAAHDLPSEPILSALFQAIDDPGTTLLVFHAAFERRILKSLGHSVAMMDGERIKIVDCAIYRRLFDIEAIKWNLKEAVGDLLEFPMIDYENLPGIEAGKKGSKSFARVPMTEAARYGAADAMLTLELFRFLEPHVEEQRDIIVLEHRVADALDHFSAVKVNRVIILDELARLRAEHQASRQMAYEAVGRITGTEGPVAINLDSRVQLAAVLTHGGYTVPTTEKGNVSLDSKVLEDAAADGQQDVQALAKAVLESRRSKKLCDYFEGLLSSLGDGDRVRPFLDSFGTRTGRFSSSGKPEWGYADLNFQNLPKGGRIREAFEAEEGFVLVDGDFKSQELRILAQLTGEPAWIEALNILDPNDPRGDLHQIVADSIGCDRETGKAVNFLTAYGGSEYALSKKLKVDKYEAKLILDKWLSTAPRIKEWCEAAKKTVWSDWVKCHRRTMATGVMDWAGRPGTRTIFGRRRFLTGQIITSELDITDQFSQQGAIDRIAINSPVQGTGADLMKMGIVNVLEWITKEGLQDDVQALLTVHDELILQVRKSRLEELQPIIVDLLCLRAGRYQVQWKVPILLDVAVVENWGQAK